MPREIAEVGSRPEAELRFRAVGKRVESSTPPFDGRQRTQGWPSMETPQSGSHGVIDSQHLTPRQRADVQLAWQSEMPATILTRQQVRVSDVACVLNRSISEDIWRREVQENTDSKSEACADSYSSTPASFLEWPPI